jgi:hypothetical protein
LSSWSVLSDERTGLSIAGFKEDGHSNPHDGERIQNVVRVTRSSEQEISERNFFCEGFSFNHHRMDPEDRGSTFL